MHKSLIAALVVGSLVLVGLLGVRDLAASYDEVQDRVHRRAQVEALILAEYLGGTFAAGDAALRQLALHSQRIGGPAAPGDAWEPSLASARAGLRGIGAISIMDAAHVIRHSTRPDIVGQSRVGEDFIANAILDGDDRLIVGEPFRSPMVGEYLLPIGRALIDARGNVEGSIIGSFLPQDLRRFFQSVSVGRRGAVWLFHAGGQVIFREPSTDDPIGEEAARNAIFDASRGASEGVVEGPIVADGPSMVSAFRRVEGLPLTVAVSIDRDDMLQFWHRERRFFVISFTGATVVLIGGLVALFRQIDARTVAERALARARAAEEQRLRDANDQLAALLEREQAARQEAENAKALTDQFVTTVSHELRTPLTAVAGWARMLADGMVGEDKRASAIQTIERNAQTLKRIIEDLLDVAGMMNGKVHLDLTTVDVASVARDALDAITPAAAAKGVRMETDIAARVGTVQADPERLQQIVYNLLSNAVKFTAEGGCVSLAVYRRGADVRIAVTDDGRGIHPDFLPHVFERFRQAPGAARRAGGLGLGLAIVRNLVELHGGTVSAHSDGEGRGAAFEVVLPGASVQGTESRP